MPPSHLQTHAVLAGFSASRKRTHAEITRSESRSRSPQPSSKRRRTIPSTSPTSFADSPASDWMPGSSESGRFVGDGLDFRQPVMSTPPPTQPHEVDTIDLTLDDDTPPLDPPSPIASHNLEPIYDATRRDVEDEGMRRAPPFIHRDTGQTLPIIDLLSDDDDELEIQGEGTRVAPWSPEIQFMGERTLPQPTASRHETQGRTIFPGPRTVGRFGSMANFLRGMTQNMFVSLRGNRELQDTGSGRMDGFLDSQAVGRDVELPPEAFLDIYDGLQMDYGRTAFNLGSDVLLIDDPILPHPPNHRNDTAYKAPQPVPEGFTRNYEEDDMLVCGLCGNELATGESEQKQQVWIVKQCGHAYCGDCAHNRNMSKQKNNKDLKRQSGKKLSGFKVCAIPGCNKTVDSKTKMFQIYL